MVANQPQKKNGKLPKQYAKKLERVKQLRAEYRATVGSAVWERTRLLVELFDDEGYREKCADAFPGRVVSDNVLADLFDREYVDDVLADFGLAFLDLRRMLERFADCQQWQERSLLALYEEAKYTRDPKQQPPPKQRHVVKRAEFDAAVAERETARADLQKSQQVAKRLHMQIDRHESELERLRRRVLELESRVAELETENEQLREELAGALAVA